MNQEGGSVALTPEELADRLVPDDPRLSPDGRSVVFAVAPRGKREAHKRQALWLSRDGEPAQPFTAGTAHDANPRWSPDGTTVLFCSDRIAHDDETFRLFLIPAAGGEARPLGDLDGALSQPSWSPDGRSVVVLRKDPKTVEERARAERRDDAIVAGEAAKRSRVWLIEVATGKARCLTFGERQVWSYAWTPEGDALVVVTTATPDLDTHYGPSAVGLVPVGGGLSRAIATFPSLPTEPVVVAAPDGPLVAAMVNANRDDPQDAVWTVPLSGGEPRRLGPAGRAVVEALAPLTGSPGGLAVAIGDGVHGRLLGVDAGSGESWAIAPASLPEGGYPATAPSVSADGRRITVVWSNPTTPEEVWIGEAGGEGAPVTAFGEAFRGRLSPAETVRWSSPDGVEIEGVLTLPAEATTGRPVPLVVEVHGGPWWHWGLSVMLDWHDWAQLLASRGIAVLAPNPRGSTAYGSAFQRLLQDDVGGGEAQDLIAGAQAMVARGIADPERLGIAGWSWGGYLSAWAITQTDLFAAAFVGAGVTNLVSDHGTGDIPAMNLGLFPGMPYAAPDAYWERSPIRHAARITAPTLIAHGDADDRVHPAQGMELHRALTSLGVPTRFLRYPREGHLIAEREHQIHLMREIVGWFGRWLIESP